MSLLYAMLLGVIQGLTEFLPISSSGHLAIFQTIFHMKDVGISFDVFLHLGTLVAVFVVYWKDILRLIVEFFGIVVDVCKNIGIFFSRKNRDKAEYHRIITTAYRKFTLLIIVASIPTAILGVLGKKIVEEAGNHLWIVGICLIVTAVLLIVSDNLPDGRKTPKGTKWKDAVIIGIAQGIATLPGISRSGATICTGIFRGLRRDFVVKFSFIMSIPAILGATVFEIPDMADDFAGGNISEYLAGAMMAAIVGYFCIRLMLVVVKNKKFKYFAYYCTLAGVVAIVGSLIAR